MKKGEIYIRKSECTGYFMVMDFEQDQVKTSPLFWCEAITYHYKKKKDLEIEYKRHSGNLGNSIVQARYDHELMRRGNKL